MLTHDEVIWGYRYILGREPESDAVVRAHAMAANDVAAFRKALLLSEEFAGLSFQVHQPCWVAAPVLNGTRLMCIDLSDRYVSLGCLQDAYEKIETRFIRGVLKAADVFVDVGANVGWFTMLASTIIGKKGRIHAFEPRRPIVDYLQRTVVLNGLSEVITVYPIGLSNEAKTETLIWNSSSDNGGSASFGRGDASPEMACQTIEVQPLDSLNLGHVDVIKIDVEGAEPLVLEGAKKTIERDRPIILTEILPTQLKRVSDSSPQDLIDFFLSKNYRGYVLDHVRCGENIRTFREVWERGVVNIGFAPEERAIDRSVFGT